MGFTKGQQQCIETLDKPLVVAAGAGSGKTFTLTKRIVGALQAGYVTDIGEVCAITFTTKAAGELKSRIKSELRACGLAEQSLKVDEAWISTIHGMCSRILRAHAIELGIDPAFEVIGDVHVGEYLAQAVDEVLVEAQLDGGSERLDALFAAYKARSSSRYDNSVEKMLNDLVREAAAHADGIDSFVRARVAMKPHMIVERSLEVIEDQRALAAEEKASGKRDAWITATDALIGDARTALEGGVASYEDALKAIAPFKIAADFGGKEYKARVAEARGMVGALVMEARLGAAQGHLDTLIDLASHALDRFVRMKSADGALDNNDLLVMAARAIEEHPAIAEQYADKFKLVMVDEFQDTDQMQVDMIKRLSGEGAQRLCVVGDAQQSIYRFRGADVSVYRRHLESVRADRGEESVIRLFDNFRSHADVLAFVDRVFEKPGMFGGEFMSLSPGRDEDKVAAPFEDSLPRIVVQHSAGPSKGMSGDQVIEAGARRLARRFAELVSAGHSPGEMAVLLGSMTKADMYARALRDEGLSCVISGGSVFAESEEAAVVRELVRVIANPHETKSLFNVLAGPLFSLTAGDLLEVGGLEGFWRAVWDDRADTFSSLRLTCALRVMADAHERFGKASVSSIVEMVVADSGWLSRLEREGAEGLASAGNIFKAIRMLASIEREGASGPVSVMRLFEKTLECSKEAPGVLSVSGSNSVRIMTVHASKGLEFPIVAVAEMKGGGSQGGELLMSSVGDKVYLSLDLGSQSAVDRGKVDDKAVRAYVLGDIADEEDLAAAVQRDEGALFRHLAIGGHAAAGDGEEAKRLLYVALTRAKEALVVVTSGKYSSKDPIGLPKNVFSGVYDALGGGTALGEGTCQIEFGGHLPAVVECTLLSLDDGEEDASPNGLDDRRNTFMVPAVDLAAEKGSPVALEAYRPLREGVFSYSSISDASHDGDVLDRLANAFAVATDQAASGPFESFAAHETGIAPSGDDFWDVDPSQAFDEDRATDLGTAFHRLAQYAVVVRREGEMLAHPPAERVDALARTCNLDGVQRNRLSCALDRWFGCDLAHEMSELPFLAAEVPFFVAVEGAYLEGEIDLLGFDAERKKAFVVDYKTGGSADEAPADLRRKHVLQAACYAYAILLQGVSSVDAVFARVERGRSDDEAQPQCARYRFGSECLPVLEQSIAEVYAKSRT